MSIRYVRGHIEVFDEAGRFLFSADTAEEAHRTLREEEEEGE